MIPTQETKINGTLTSVRDGLIVVDDNLAGAVAHVSQQGGA